METPKIVLPEWTTWAWSSLTERAYWQPLLREASTAWSELERWSVVDGVRPAVYQHVDPDELMAYQKWAQKHGLAAIPITQTPKSTSYQSSAPQQSTLGYDYRVLLTTLGQVQRILTTPNLHLDDAALGEILGYPECCRTFFLKTWSIGQVDTTWDQYVNSAPGSIKYTECNMLWRWMGIRWVSHLPCSHHCQATIDLARSMRQVTLDHGFVEEAKTIDHVLSWPVTWSGVNGIAEIVGPCLKISTRTDWAPPSANRYFAKPGVYFKPSADLWDHNKFGAYDIMREFHKPLVSVINEFAPLAWNVWDLGCGNGALLRRAKLHRPDIQIGGNDINSDAIVYAEKIGVGDWVESSIQDFLVSSDVGSHLDIRKKEQVLVYSPVRLEEMDEATRTHTRHELLQYPIHIVYAYTDTLTMKPLETWCESVGLPIHRLKMVHIGDPKIAIGVFDFRT